MDPSKQLVDIWSRLPTFRVVAMTEHLPTASRQLHVTAPAISRTIRLLEEDLGQPLFRRAGRSLVLNAAGKRLLAALNGATLSLEAILSELAADPFVGPVRISTIGVLTDYFVLPALLTLRERHPELQPCLEVQRTLDANERISSGRLDVAFYYEALTDERLEIERLGETTASVYCGRSHPLFAMEKVSLEALLEQPFSVPQFGDSGQVMDGWPVDQPRKIGMRITMLYTNLHVCLSGRFVTVLPDVVAAEYVERGQLRRLLAQPISPIPVYAARRRTDGENTVAASVVEAVRKVLLDEEKSA